MFGSNPFGWPYFGQAFAGTRTYSDSPSGVEASTGSETESWSNTVSVSGSAASSGSIVAAKIAADVVSGTETSTGSRTEAWSNSTGPSGSAASTGTTAENDSQAKTISGTAASSGSVSTSTSFLDARAGVEASSGSPLDIPSLSLAPSPALPPGLGSHETWTGSTSPLGAASSNGSVSEGGPTTQPQGFSGGGGLYGFGLSSTMQTAAGKKALRTPAVVTVTALHDSPYGWSTSTGQADEHWFHDEAEELLLAGVI